MKQYLSKKQIAKALKEPPSNISHYVNVYSDYIPSHKLDGNRHPVYDDLAVEILREIKKNIDKGKSQGEIKQILENMYPLNYQTDNNQADLTTTKEQQVQNWVRATDIQQLTLVVKHHDKITQSALGSLESYKTLLETKEMKLERLQQQVDKLQQQNDLKDLEISTLKDKIDTLKRPSLLSKLIGQ